MELQWPLIIFTTLVAWSAGTFGTQAAFALKGGAARAQQPAAIVSAVLLAAAGVAMALHLQRWDRIFNGFGHLSSGITQELIGVVVLLVALAAYLILLRRRGDGTVPVWAAAAALVLAVALVVVVGRSFLVAARPNWDSALQIASLLGIACALGTATFSAVDAATSAEASRAHRLTVPAGALLAAVTGIAFVFSMGSTSGYNQVPFYFDPTRPNAGMVDTSQFSAFAGDNLGFSVAAIVFAVLGMVFALLGRRGGTWKVWGVCVVVCALVVAVALRILFYQVGGSAFYLTR